MGSYEDLPFEDVEGDTRAKFEEKCRIAGGLVAFHNHPVYARTLAFVAARPFFGQRMTQPFGRGQRVEWFGMGFWEGPGDPSYPWGK